MKTNGIFLFLVLWTLWGCSPTGRSINEPLTLDQLNSVLKKDPDYAATFALTERYQKKGLSDTEKAYLNDLTYKQLHKFLKKYNDPAYTDKLKAEYGQDWKKEYGALFDRVDSIDAYWKQYFTDHQLSSFVAVEWIRLDKNHPDLFLGGTRVTFRITPLKGRIEELDAYFGLVPKGSQPFYTYYQTTGRNHLHIDAPFSQPVTEQAYLSFNSAFDIDVSDLQSMNLSELATKYNFDVDLTRIKKDGEYLTPVQAWTAVPDPVREMWNQRNKDSWNEFSKDLYYADIVKALIDPAYIPQHEYIAERVREHFYDLDPLAAKFVYEIVD